MNSNLCSLRKLSCCRLFGHGKNTICPNLCSFRKSADLSNTTHYNAKKCPIWLLKQCSRGAMVAHQTSNLGVVGSIPTVSVCRKCFLRILIF